MERLLPKNDYFKHTTRIILTESQKRRTIDAVHRAEHYLGRMSSQTRMEHTISVHGREVLKNMHDGMIFFSRWVNLVKGSTQPRHLYRRRRRQAIASEALKISEETGASASEVNRLFMHLMDKYVSDHP